MLLRTLQRTDSDNHSNALPQVSRALPFGIRAQNRNRISTALSSLEVPFWVVEQATHMFVLMVQIKLLAMIALVHLEAADLVDSFVKVASWEARVGLQIAWMALISLLSSKEARSGRSP